MGADPNDDATSRGAPSPSASDAATRTASRASGAPVSLSALFSPLPERIGEFVVARHIKTGGQGVVFEAVQASLDRPVAVKVAINRAGPDDPLVRRFVDEARLLAGVEHENVARVYASGTAVINGWSTRYYAMELVPGAATLTEFAAARGLSTAERIALFTRVCDAVHAVHTWDKSPLLHRDLKPGNILVSAGGTPKIIDFGLARERDDDAPRASPDQARSDTISGTLPYMSPEQCDPDAVLTPASDVYSLGVTLYELLSGRRPLDLPTRADEALRAIKSQPPAPLRVGGRPADGDLAAIVSAALEKRAEDRLPTAAALADHLRRYLEGRPLPVRDREPLYRMLARLRLASARRPLAVAIGIAAAATAMGEYLGVTLVYRWTGANEAFERIVSAVLPAPTFDGVRVIAVDNPAELASLAAAEGIQGVDPSSRATLRPLHGRLMERLAKAGPAVVAWDIFFKKPGPDDAALELGAKALRDAGVGVVFGVDSWSVSPQGMPEVLPSLLTHGPWGGATAVTPPASPWSVDLALDRQGVGVLPSLAVMAVAEARRPGARYSVGIDVNLGTITIVPQQANASAHGVPLPNGAPIEIRATGITKAATASQQTMGVLPSDSLGCLAVGFPPDPALAAITIPYIEAMTAPPAKLRSMLAGKVVIVGPFFKGEDLHPYMDGREIRGAYAHAVAIDAMLRGVQPMLPTPAQTVPITACGAVLGVAAAISSRRSRSLVLAVLSGLALLVIASITALRAANMLVNPLVAGLALLAAAGIALAVRPVRHSASRLRKFSDHDLREPAPSGSPASAPD